MNDAFVQKGGESGELIRAFDWAKTSLGPMASWPQSLRTSVSTMLRSPYPIILFWGRDRVMLYNDPFRPILGEKHPGTVGAYGRVALVEAWEILGPLMDKALATGEPLFIENGAVFFARMPGGQQEEAYFTWSYNPTIGEDGEIAGLFAIASETTGQVVGERRLAVLRELSLRTAYDRKVDSVFRSVEQVLAEAPADVTFALLYVFEGDTARLVSAAGVERGSPVAPETLDVGNEASWPLARVARTGEEALVTAPASVGALPGGRWPEPATHALLLNVPIGADARTTGVLVTGVSPRLPLDDDYRSFLQLLARQISAGVSSARAYEEETHRAEKLAELDRAKTDFFSNVSHEFRTPLTLILGPVEDAFARGTGALDGQELELVRRNAVRLYKMVNALLDFSRIEAGRAQATFVQTDLAAFTASLASHFRSAAESAKLELVVACPPLPAAVFVDPEMWEKIVFNILSNAIKYTRAGSIRLRLEADGPNAVLQVEDTGVGISESDRAHVFERFYRVRGTEGRSHEGTGIGLALVRELAEMHGGDVSVASTPGVGSTFTVRMPFGSAHLDAQRIDASAPPVVVAPAAHAAPFVEEALRWNADTTPRDTPDATVPVVPRALRASRILLVDDNADLREYVAGLLGRVFTNVETATNGLEGLEKARASLPDLVLSDVMMPLMDGFDLVRALRAEERTRSIPIILLSARAGDESTVEGLDSGADDYLVKPFSSRELLARVRTQLEMSRIRSEVWSERARVEQLVRSATVRDELLTVLAHELRTPLTTLELQLETLHRTLSRDRAGSDQRSIGKLDMALQQTDRLTRLVDSLVDVSHATLGTLTLDHEVFDLADVVRRLVERVAVDAASRGTTFSVDANASVFGAWDRRRLEDALLRLLSNAMKYAPGTQVDISVREEEDRAVVRVRDRGPGIAPSVIGRIFDKFERVGSVEHHSGFGIGLYLARQLVEAHGGELRAESTPPEGAVFTMTLPRGELIS